jgi:gliotoxin/aspirochlorine biosynthesis peptide synthetase
MLFSALANGGTVIPVQPENVYQKASSCTVMAATPSILSSLPSPIADDGTWASMHTVILGGETATSDLLGSWLDAGIRVLTAYGVTETTSMGCIYEQDQEKNPFLIGRFMEQSPIYLLNCDLSLVEDDFAEGEIVIAGDGVAQGYYNNSELTTKKFGCWKGRRIYKTGDYGRWVRVRGERVLEFRGRKDRTIKNRGFLVNLDRDVEEALYQVGKPLGVKSVHAVATENGIIAVVTPSSVDTIALLEKAKLNMCAYCIPCRIETVQNFPLSSNGKVQPKAVLDIIAAIDNERNAAGVAALVTENFEGKLAKILRAAAEVLGYEQGKIRGEDSFLGMGGSSLLAFKLVSVLRRDELDISVKDIFKCQTFSEIARRASDTSNSEGEPAATKDTAVAQNLADLRRQSQTELNLPEKTFDVGPLTSLQLELALPTLADESSGINQLKITYGSADAATMERAWRAVWQAEPVFRTEISLTIGSGGLIIHKKAFRKPALKVYNNEKDYAAAVKAASMAIGLGCSLEFFAYSEGAMHSQSVSSASISRERTIPKETRELTVVLTIHHSLMDGFSLRLILDNVERAAQGRCLLCRPSSIDANLGIMAVQQKRDAEAREFFSCYLNNANFSDGGAGRQSIDSPTQIEGTERGTRGRTNTIFFEPSADISTVTAFARNINVSAASIYYTAWAMALSAFQCNACVVVGAVFSDRATLPNHETVGAYVSTLPLVFRFDANETVNKKLQHTMNDLATVGQYAWARSDQVGIGGRLSNLLAMQLPLPDEHSKPPPVRVESLENSDFPLCMLVEANGTLRILFDSTKFDYHVARRLGEHFKHSLYCLLHANRVGDCMKTNQLQETVLQLAEQVRSEPGTKTVKQALEQSIDRFSDLVALEDCSGTKLTYRKLDEVANVIAHCIDSTLPGTKAVAIYGDGTIGWTLGLLGIFKAGRVYVPLDPKWPMERRAAVCEKSGAAAVLLPSNLQQHEAPEMPGIKILAVDSILQDSHGNKAMRLPDIASPDSDLVIVFTSGTTGTPKGVPISHRGFLALQSNPEATLFAAPGRRIAQFMSTAFDCCNVEIFSALLHGATLVLRDSSDPYAHLQKANTAVITPSVLSVLNPDDFPHLEIVNLPFFLLLLSLLFPYLSPSYVSSAISKIISLSFVPTPSPLTFPSLYLRISSYPLTQPASLFLFQADLLIRFMGPENP